MGWLNGGREAGCPGKVTCGPAAAPRAVGFCPSGGRAVPGEEPPWGDESQEKWA